MQSDRRTFLGAAGVSIALVACKKDDDDDDVGAVEDLMREHGVIRRALVVFRESAIKLRANGASVPLEPLASTARLVRSFGEDYHEKILEEVHIFPAVKRAGGVAAAAVDTLIEQHQRGREIIDFVLAQSAITAGSSEPLARALEAFARMYELHAAVEDTQVFPAWKKTSSKRQLHELAETFEEIEIEEVPAEEEIIDFEELPEDEPPKKKKKK